MEDRDKHNQRSKIWYQTNKEKHNTASRQRSRRIKEEAIKRYGGVCYCCGEKIIQFLALDHVNGNGNQHRKTTKTEGGVQFYRWLKRRGWPDGYQVACHNCNMGRHLNGGICPHQNNGRTELVKKDSGT